MPPMNDEGFPDAPEPPPEPEAPQMPGGIQDGDTMDLPEESDIGYQPQNPVEIPQREDVMGPAFQARENQLVQPNQIHFSDILLQNQCAGQNFGQFEPHLPQFHKSCANEPKTVNLYSNKSFEGM